MESIPKKLCFLCNQFQKSVVLFGFSNESMYFCCLIREKVVTFRMVKLNLLLSIFCITK